MFIAISGNKYLGLSALRAPTVGPITCSSPMSTKQMQNSLLISYISLSHTFLHFNMLHLLFNCFQYIPSFSSLFQSISIVSNAFFRFQFSSIFSNMFQYICPLLSFSVLFSIMFVKCKYIPSCAINFNFFSIMSDTFLHFQLF